MAGAICFCPIFTVLYYVFLLFLFPLFSACPDIGTHAVELSLVCCRPAHLRACPLVPPPFPIARLVPADGVKLIGDPLGIIR